MVSQDWLDAEIPHSRVSAGTTADAENQTDIARSSAVASTRNGFRLDEGIFRVAYISKVRANVNFGVLTFRGITL
jgi:hypothetical protein